MQTSFGTREVIIIAGQVKMPMPVLYQSDWLEELLNCLMMLVISAISKARYKDRILNIVDNISALCCRVLYEGVRFNMMIPPQNGWLWQTNQVGRQRRGGELTLH